SESGVTSSRSRSLTSPASTPAWIAAPTATTSSGFTPLCGSLPKSSLTIACIRERLLGRPDALLQQVLDELLELRARQLHREVLGSARVRGDERQVDVG